MNNTFEMLQNKQVTRWVSWKTQGETAVLKEPNPTAMHLSDWHLGVCLHGVHVQYGYQCIGCILSVMLAVCRTSGGWNGVREGTGLVNRKTVWQQMDCWTTKETSCVCVCVSMHADLHAACHPHTTACIHYYRHTGPFSLWQTHPPLHSNAVPLSLYTVHSYLLVDWLI